MASSYFVKLNDGEVLEFTKAQCDNIPFLKEIIDDIDDESFGTKNSPILLPSPNGVQVTSFYMKEILNYIDLNAEKKLSGEEKKKYFHEKIGTDLLEETTSIRCENYLKITNFLAVSMYHDLTKFVGEYISEKGLSAPEIRRLFSQKCDLSVEKKIRTYIENSWAFETEVDHSKIIGKLYDEIKKVKKEIETDFSFDKMLEILLKNMNEIREKIKKECTKEKEKIQALLDYRWVFDEEFSKEFFDSSTFEKLENVIYETVNYDEEDAYIKSVLDSISTE